jgi:diaminopimelate decarboxylase
MSEMSGYAVPFDQMAEPTREMLSCKGGHLYVEGVDVAVLADEVPTPFFLFSGAQVARNISSLVAAFKTHHARTRIFYASKACSNLWMLDRVRRAGIDVEVNSGGELKKALRAGFASRQIAFNGVAKSEAEIVAALDPPIEAIVIDSVSELRRVSSVAERLGALARISLRFDLETASDTHPALRTSGGAKAGIDLREAYRAFSLAGCLPNIDLVGVHYHIGSQVTQLAPYAEAVGVALPLLESLERSVGHRMEHLCVGGGFPIPYFDPPFDLGDTYFAAPHGIEDYAEVVCSSLRRRPDLTLLLEPGRAVIGNAAVLVCRVEAEKSKVPIGRDGGRADRWLLIDAGFNTLLEHSSYHWYFRALAANLCDQAHERHFRMGGPLCDGGDVYAGEPGSAYRHLPAQTGVGDLITFLDVGAYSLECMSAYNGRDQAAAYLADGSVIHEIMRRRTVEDFMADEHFEEERLVGQDVTSRSNDSPDLGRGPGPDPSPSRGGSQ